MNAGPYPRYRDSGVEWLGEVPEHWDLRQLGLFGSFFKGSGGTKEDEVDDGVPCVRYGDLYTRHQYFIRETRADISEESAAKYTPIRYGDILFAGSGETIEEIGKSAANLIDGPAYCGGDVIVFRPAIEADATFLGYAADCSTSIYQKARMGRGVTVMHIYGQELRHLLLPLPPLDEQRAIAAYLDRETERIDALVAKKRLLIERLEEYRSALITRTVTRGLPPEAARAAGLDPSPRLKPSGVEWLGEVPEHWEVQRLRDCGRIQTGPFGSQLHADEYVSGGTPIINPANIAQGRLVPDDEGTITPAKASELVRHAFRAGDIAFGRRGEMARVALVLPSDLPALCGTGCLRVDPDRQRVEPSFLLLALGLEALRDWLELVAVGSTLANLNEQIVGRIPVVLPPLGEQRAIVAFLERETERVAELVGRTEAAIERLQEYRTALITAAVTGKIDVRE